MYRGGWQSLQKAVGNAFTLPLKWRASSAEHLASKQRCPFNERTDTHAGIRTHSILTQLYWTLCLSDIDQTPNKILTAPCQVLCYKM